MNSMMVKSNYNSSIDLFFLSFNNNGRLILLSFAIASELNRYIKQKKEN